MTHAVRLPIVHGSAIAGQVSPCLLPKAAQAFAAAWMAIVDKPHITCHPLLVMAAQQQADWLAVHDFMAGNPHGGENGSTANARVKATGFRLPGWMMAVDNVVESTIRSWGSAEDAAHELAHHDAPGNSHKAHMQFLDWWERWGFCYYGVGAAEAQLPRGGWFYVAVTGVEE